MNYLCIGSKDKTNEVRDILFDFVNSLEDKEYREYILFEEVELKDVSFYEFSIDNILKNKFNIDYKKILSDIISDIIIKVYSKSIIKKNIVSNYNEYNKAEKEEIMNMTLDFIKNDFQLSKEKKIIKDELNEYLNIYDEVFIDGFVNFRLKSFNRYINEIVNNSVEEFLAQKDYKEFIKILQYFVEIQESKMDLINVVVSDKEYKLYDSDNNIIDSDYFSEILNELVDEGIGKDDLLISSLITIAPQKIIIHISKENRDRDVIKVIENVFLEKVSFCSGCNLCKLQVPIKKS